MQTFQSVAIIFILIFFYLTVRNYKKAFNSLNESFKQSQKNFDRMHEMYQKEFNKNRDGSCEKS